MDIIKLRYLERNLKRVEYKNKKTFLNAYKKVSHLDYIRYSFDFMTALKLFKIGFNKEEIESLFCDSLLNIYSKYDFFKIPVSNKDLLILERMGILENLIFSLNYRVNEHSCSHSKSRLNIINNYILKFKMSDLI